MFRVNKYMCAMGIPLVLSSVAVIKNSVALFILFILAHFLILKVIPAFKHYESIGMFVMVMFSYIPVNIYILFVLYDMELLYGQLAIIVFLKGILFYVILLSIEEIVMGVMTRWIWRKQHNPLV